MPGAYNAYILTAMFLHQWSKRAHFVPSVLFPPCQAYYLPLLGMRVTALPGACIYCGEMLLSTSIFQNLGFMQHKLDMPVV